MAIQANMLFVLGQSFRGSEFDLVSSNLRSIVEDKRLPEGYDPDESVLITLQDGCDSDDLRDAFLINVNNAICEFCPDDDAFPCPGVPEDIPTFTNPLGGVC